MLFNITNYIEFLIINYGLIAIFFLMMLNGILSAPPSEAVLSFSGAMAAVYKYSFGRIFLTAVIGNLCGAIILYFFSRHFGHKWLFRLKENLKKQKLYLLKWSEKFIPDEETYEVLCQKFRDDGEKWVCLFRCFPVVRSVISIPAGVAKMNLFIFIYSSALGISLWALGWQLLGYYTVKNWTEYQWYISAPLFIVCILFILYMKKKIDIYLRKNMLNIQS